MFKRILVGYAGDRAGRDAVQLAVRLQSLMGSALTVVIPYHPLFAAVPGEVAEQRAREELEAMLGGAMPEGTRFHWSNANWPIHALHELAEYERDDLIVLGAAPERIERRHVGLMERMVHGAPCAIAIAPEGYAERPAGSLSRIGVGFADTAEGRAAVAEAREIARLSGADGVKLIAGAGLTGALLGYAAMSAALPEAEAEMLEEATASAERVARQGAGHDSVEVRHEDPAHLLVACSEQLDLLVLGSRDYGPLRHVLLGSVSAAVMRESRCPVVVLPRRTPQTAPAQTEAAFASA
ncbi:MAG TPA: universal stress protein [Solirubrobacteraceae bacterium]|nr:universal stress protein [Solirubrobacteraceae bacterium]